MKITLTLLAILLAWSPAQGKSTDTSAQREDASKTDKRALAEGNSGLNKRAPLQGSPGVEYAETTESLPDKSPPQDSDLHLNVESEPRPAYINGRIITHPEPNRGQYYITSKSANAEVSPEQVYATPVPQVSKISDVLTGHGPSFPTAIANHLYSPIQVYQPLAKVDVPTTYQVSAPVPSHLAYTEHKTFYPGPSAPQPNGIQYYNQPQRIFIHQPQAYTQQPQAYPQQPLNFARATALSYTPPQQVPYLQRTLDVQSQYSSVPQQLITFAQPQPGYFHQQFQPSVAYVQAEQSNPSDTRPQTFSQSQPAQNSVVTYGQNQNSPDQTGVTYVQALAPAPLQLATSQTSYTAPGVIPKPIQRQLNAQPINVIDKNSDVDNQAIKNEVKPQSGRGAVSYASFSQNTAGNQAPTLQGAYLPSAPKSAIFTQNTLPINANYIPSVAKPLTAPGYGSIGQTAGYYSQPSFYHTAPQQVFLQGPSYQGAQHGYAQQNLAAVPTFPAVQYFGEFAHNLLGGYTH